MKGGNRRVARPAQPIPHPENSLRPASGPRCSRGHVRALDKSLKRIGGDILEMSCAGIISIPFVLTCVRSVRVSGQRGGGGGGSFSLLFKLSFSLGSTKQLEALAAQRLAIISASHLKAKARDRHRLHQEDSS